MWRVHLPRKSINGSYCFSYFEELGLPILLACVGSLIDRIRPAPASILSRPQRVSYRLFALIAGIVLAHDALASSSISMPIDQLEGVWFVESATPQGMLVQVATFKKQGDRLLGTWSLLPRWLTGSIDHVRNRNGRVSFRVTFGPGAVALWKGDFRGGDTLAMTLIGQNGVPIHSRTFRRASRGALAEAELKAPKGLITRVLPLPRIKKLSFNGQALTPPMGWNSWNFFKESIDDKSVRQIADALVQTGLRDAGYTIVTIDDGWQGERDTAGIIHPNVKFPDMRSLADYLHSRGLKFGIYSSPGPLSCGGYLGSHGYEVEDAHTFASWGVDFMKYDWCSAGSIYKTQSDMQALYQKMGEALRDSRRPIIYSICQYGKFDVGSWGRDVGGNLWRTGGDTIEGNRWASMSSRFTSDGDPKDNGPGGWNDPDMMLVGINGLSVEEYRTHMTLWSMLAAPLVIGNDVRSMLPEVKKILLNKEVLQVDQDTLGRQGTRVAKSGQTEVWVKPLSGGALAIALFNRGAWQVNITENWNKLGIVEPQQVRDLWKNRDLGIHRDGISAIVASHSAALLRVTKAP